MMVGRHIGTGHAAAHINTTLVRPDTSAAQPSSQPPAGATARLAWLSVLWAALFY
jgi:hypothetical protein